MDSTDVKILKLLQENSRISISELSKKVTLSLSAVSERIKKLEASGIVKGYTAIINPEAMHKNLSVLMMISIDNTSGEKDFFRIVDDEDEILECHHITGYYDYAIRVVTENTAMLEDLMTKLKSIPGVRGTQTIVFLSTFKHRYSVTPTLVKN